MIPVQPIRVPRATGRQRHGPLPVVGLTGGIGGGKSEVAALLKERGAVVIDADAVGHEILDEPSVRSQIADRFGAGVLSSSGGEPGSPAAVDRRALGAIVFADSRARQDLEAIVHPKMRARFVELIDRERQAGGGEGRLVVLDAAILLEAGWDQLCDVIVFVDAPRAERLARVERQRGWSRTTFDAREQAQWHCDRKRRDADLVIINDAGIDSLRREVEWAAIRLLQLSRPINEAPTP